MAMGYETWADKLVRSLGEWTGRRRIELIEDIQAALVHAEGLEGEELKRFLRLMHERISSRRLHLNSNYGLVGGLSSTERRPIPDLITGEEKQ